MKPLIALLLLTSWAFVGCQRPSGGNPAANADGSARSLAEARSGFRTQLTRQESANESVVAPPGRVFRNVHYPTPAGKLAAYLTPDPRDGKKHPAIVWITGGDCNTIGEVWNDAPASNDQTAAAYRKADIVMMFPSLRGGNKNPGVKEGFLGEVDDVLAAADFLAKQEYVDPARIYLGGHSTGGTLVLLVTECSDRFRATFSFGPIDDIRGYGPEYLPFSTADAREVELRSPGRWLAAIRTPTFVFEGAVDGNVEALQTMSRANRNPKVQLFPVRGANHFSILAPTNDLIAAKILQDSGPTCNLSFTEAELRRLFGGR